MSQPTALKVFGIGLNKTGTKTLGQCCTRLGFRTIGYRADFLVRLKRRDFAPIFDEIDEYDAFEDWPYPLMYQELFERYGDRAKFVLTTRKSASVWLDSLKRHSLRTNVHRHARLLTYGYAYPFGAEEHFINLYERHVSQVREFFAGHGGSLCELCWETGSGWSELCAFLGVDPPDEAFPHANEGGSPRRATLVANVARVYQQLILLNPHLNDEELTELLERALASAGVSPKARASLVAREARRKRS